MSNIQQANKKSCYQFTVNASWQQIDQVIQSFLAANGFKREEKNDYQYYYNNNTLGGKKFFEYEIEGKSVVIYAYVGSVKKPIMLGDAAMLGVSEYRKMLEPLLMQLQQAGAPQQPAYYQQAGAPQQPIYNQQAGAPQQPIYNQQAGTPQQPAYYQQAGAPQQPIYNQQMNVPPQQTGNINGNTYNYFKKQENEANGKLAIIAFVLAVIQIIISFAGFYYGGILLFLEIYYAVKGLKSDKMLLSIATFVLVFISIYQMIQWIS